MKLRRDLSAIRDGIEQLHKAINEHARSIRAADERQRNEDISRKAINVVVSYDDKTISDTKAENDRQYTAQNSIRWTTFCAFLAALIYASIAALQLQEMRTQTSQIYSQSNIENAGSSHRAAEASRQLKIAQEQADAAAMSASAIQEQMREDQRAWVHEVDQAETVRLQDGFPIFVQIQLTNTGKTIARNINAVFAISVYGKNEEPEFLYGNGHPAYGLVPIFETNS